MELIQAHGLDHVREPYLKHLEEPLWEMRMKGRGGIARAIRVTAAGKRIVDRPRLRKEDPENAAKRDIDSTQASQGASMKQQLIPVQNSFREWRKDPDYVAAYAALEEEFALASALIKARSEAGLTRQQVATAMGTTQAVVARLESGKVPPSTRSLARFAQATHTRLRITFAGGHFVAGIPPAALENQRTVLSLQPAV